MNIRSLSNLNQAVVPERVHELQNRVKSHDTTERDADGREPHSDKPRKITDEELEKLLKSLREHPGIKANNLTVDVVTENLVQLILIKDPQGNIVRRVTEDQFYTLLNSMDQANGRLLNKAA
ncbi:MAG: hypothetical protein K2Q26_03405 [Bdellovibrionales bacterium]|nr:hypothetical protein [Bdellovibrionales bacterium]